MYRVMIVDDELLIRETLIKLINDYTPISKGNSELNFI